MTTTAVHGQELLITLDLLGDPRITAPKAAPPTNGPPTSAAETGYIVSENPANGQPIAAVKLNTKDEYDAIVQRAMRAQEHWRMLPAPKRGEIVRLIGNAFRDKLEPLGELITLEMGVSSRLCAYLKPGEPVVVMGPTGTPTEIPVGGTALLAGGNRAAIRSFIGLPAAISAITRRHSGHKGYAPSRHRWCL